MKMSPLSQFDVISIIPFLLGNNEFTLSNLSLTVLFVVVFGLIFFKASYAGQLIPRG